MKLKNINFKPEASAEVIEKAKAWLSNHKKEFRSTANFCIFNSKGDDYPRIGGACHNQLAYCTLMDRAVVATEVGYDRRNREYPEHTAFAPYHKTRELIEPYIRWLTTESYMAEFILNRDDLDFCCEFGLVVSCDVLTPLMQNIMIATRGVYEQPAKLFEVFNDLTQNRGVSGDLAFIACFGTGICAAGSDNNAVRSVSGHRPTALLTLDALKNFVVGDLGEGYGGPAFDFNNPKIFYRKSLPYTGGLKLFYPNGRGISSGLDSSATYKHMIYQLTAMDEFKTELAAHRKAGNSPGGVYRPPNPFTAKEVTDAPQAHEITYKEFVEFALPWVQKNIVDPLVGGMEK